VFTAQIEAPQRLIRTFASPSPRAQVPAIISGDASAAPENTIPETTMVANVTRIPEPSNPD
jgi:hypothetical protein